MTSILDGKNILLTGGTGSFGQMFTRYVLTHHNPTSIRIYSRSEFLQYQMEQDFNDKRLRFFIGDIRDERRLARAMQGVDIVIHAAALKHVPICEYNPIEAVRTNIQGATNLINASINEGIEYVLALSTDKAVHPVNLYGATKMVMEKLLVQGNVYTRSNTGKRTKISCVRYGNVVGSRGSVVPLFIEQAKSGTITITDERMTRFWLTLEQGVQFVIQSLERMKGGEIFIPKIPSMRVTDLARAIAPDSTWNVIGMRPGEKLHEVLITEDEARHTVEYDTHYEIIPELSLWRTDDCTFSLPEGFRYSSDNNTAWLSDASLREMIFQNNES
ncbi:MAG: UDP-N-acetylglucosamine 4,6-dehydratase (inverting) [Euryarchaeota archaeon]|nr:UDP-N-acetylglucosamine 4,6-dehydratase (inverting) [Euryarchaeota archaeon]